jgi:hypothetical protein
MGGTAGTYFERVDGQLDGGLNLAPTGGIFFAFARRHSAL